MVHRPDTDYFPVTSLHTDFYQLDNIYDVKTTQVALKITFTPHGFRCVMLNRCIGPQRSGKTETMETQSRNRGKNKCINAKHYKMFESVRICASLKLLIF